MWCGFCICKGTGFCLLSQSKQASFRCATTFAGRPGGKHRENDVCLVGLLSVCRSVCPSVCLSVGISVCLSVGLSACPSFLISNFVLDNVIKAETRSFSHWKLCKTGQTDILRFPHKLNYCTELRSVRDTYAASFLGSCKLARIICYLSCNIVRFIGALATNKSSSHDSALHLIKNNASCKRFLSSLTKMFSFNLICSRCDLTGRLAMARDIATGTTLQDTLLDKECHVIPPWMSVGNLTREIENRDLRWRRSCFCFFFFTFWVCEALYLLSLLFFLSVVVTFIQCFCSLALCPCFVPTRENNNLLKSINEVKQSTVANNRWVLNVTAVNRLNSLQKKEKTRPAEKPFSFFRI